MNILFLEPFFGGSHKDVARDFAAHSAHRVEILSLAPRFWKWRMRGAALEFVRRMGDISSFDLILATDMMDITDFKALAGPHCPPIVLYFHENQLSYPLSPGEKRDFHLGFTNIVSALAADGVVFNSRFHMADFLNAAQDLIRKMPDYRPQWMLEKIRAKTRVLYPGCRVPDPDIREGGRPLVIWNHRWEYDKKPERFFRVLARLKSRGVDFSLAVLGERYGKVPPVFETARVRFQDEILVYGYQKSRAEYQQWLSRGTVVVSTADQENFGISVVEAMAQGCLPLLPDRLSYPELIPQDLKGALIYGSESDLQARLEQVLRDPGAVLETRRAIAAHAGQFSWEILIRDWDRYMEKIVKSRG